MKRVLVVNGSPREESTCGGLCSKLGFPVVWLGQPDGVKLAVQKIHESDIIVFATPVYWFNVSVPMKELIEALPEAPDFPLEGKTAYFIATCEEDGGQQAINQMFAPLNHMGFHIAPYASYFSNKNIGKKSEGGWQVEDLMYMKSQIEKQLAE